MYNLIRMFVVVSLENKLHFIFPGAAANEFEIRQGLSQDWYRIYNILSKLWFRFEKEIYWASMDESANGSYVAVILKMSRDWYNMLFSFQKIEADKKKKDLKWHRDNDNPNHEENAIDFFPSRKGKTNYPWTVMKVMVTDGYRQNNKAMVTGRPWRFCVYLQYFVRHGLS